jgi:Putative Ig domain
VRRTILVAMVSLCFAVPAFAQCEALTFLTESLQTFDLNAPANFQIEVIGGDGPYHFEITSGGLPAGLHMNAHGKITGRATEATFDHTIFVTVTDSQGCHLTHAYAVFVEDI